MDDVLTDIMKAYMAQMDSAVKISEIIYNHSGNDELTGDDIICGLVYRLMVPMTQEEIRESLKKADELMNEEDSGEEEDLDKEEDLDEEEEVYEREEENKILRKIKTNTCNCDKCSKVRVCLLNFKDHEPSDTLAQRFKDSIQLVCDEHKIYI